MELIGRATANFGTLDFETRMKRKGTHDWWPEPVRVETADNRYNELEALYQKLRAAANRYGVRPVLTAQQGPIGSLGSRTPNLQQIPRRSPAEKAIQFGAAYGIEPENMAKHIRGLVQGTASDTIAKADVADSFAKALKSDRVAMLCHDEIIIEVDPDET